jgi:hypothetical protein
VPRIAVTEEDMETQSGGIISHLNRLVAVLIFVLLVAAQLISAAPWKVLVPQGTESLWHLTAVEESAPSSEYVKIVFRLDGGNLTGAVVSRSGNGEEFPLDSIVFDGTTLTFRMTDPKGAVTPYALALKYVENRFEGYWMKSPTEIAVSRKLKLTRPSQ